MLAKGIEGATWQGSKGPLKVWRDDRFSIDDLLPYVADYLNPLETSDAPPTARLWCLEDNALKSRLGGGAASSGGVTWSLLPRKTRSPIPFTIETVQLTIFSVEVGFLTVCASPGSDKLEDWQDFMHYFRFSRYQRGVNVDVRAERRTGIDPETKQPQYAPFFPEPAGGQQEHPDGTGCFYDIIKALLSTASPSTANPLITHHASRITHHPDWWEEIFVPGQMLPFVTLYVDGVPDEEIPRLLYRVRNFFHTGQGDHAASLDLDLDNPAYLEYAQRQWFIFSLDGGAYVACDAPKTDFFRNVMPDHLDRQYFLLFLLALQQRFVLMTLSHEVATNWLPGRYGEARSLEQGPGTAGTLDRTATFTRIRDKLLWFTARGYFTQVMQQEHHHRCYQKWQETFQVPHLYQEVSEAVHYMHNVSQLDQSLHLERLGEEQQQKVNRLERRLSRVGWVLGIPVVALTYLQTLGEQEWWFSGIVALVSLIIGFVLFWLLDYFSAERRRMRGQQDAG